MSPAEIERLSIPTIGIGAGPQCDGQVQVFQDLLGLDLDFSPKHARAYANGGEIFRNAVAKYAEDVRQGKESIPNNTHINTTYIISIYSTNKNTTTIIK